MGADMDVALRPVAPGDEEFLRVGYASTHTNEWAFETPCVSARTQPPPARAIRCRRGS